MVAFWFLETIFYTTVKISSRNLGSYGSFHNRLHVAPLQSIHSMVTSTLETMLSIVQSFSPQSRDNQHPCDTDAQTREPNEDTAIEASLPPPYSVSCPGQFVLTES